ncbi:Fic family protein [Campylobacter fetus]|uniref:Fic family protein n=1 Tax=Campylobacter fetus TaxID=196 RepID=UPI000508E805|nr:Fic family protein [Campylobacter fetus]WKW17936.1 Fic family protein [Campylobacter fetus subsp. fetus]AIR78561.1 Fic domain protein [Campylobacter fetus subsp. fetus 04/554]EAJ5693221.1 Fic family protein [Campylobacter fetus]EAJ5704843.1 Fic family protein [Campylobacter fetus]EAJ9257433.1 Fic family protein [Campylobacter fetus]
MLNILLLDNVDYINDLTVRMAHHSTAIEGNTLTQDETASIILNSIIPKKMNEREYYEVKNYKNLIPLITKKLGENQKVDNELIKEFHSVLMQNLIYNAGSFKTIENVIVGASFETEKPYKISFVLKDWCDNLNFRLENSKNDDERLKAILEAHIKFERIHPFSDGNGMVGRTLIFYSTLEQNLVPFVIFKDIKNNYITALRDENVNELFDIAKKAQEYEKNRINLFLEKQNNQIDFINNLL